mmetsp:Transcript_35440/g.99870  ORF Transcript_35440/g.99870 Transcript_35440/m.99870 type:complete len:1027 (-) Transcript_35440:134-3214(-)
MFIRYPSWNWIVLGLVFLIVNGEGRGVEVDSMACEGMAERPLNLPRNEDRVHDQFFLNNGVQVILVSDPTADRAATAMDVRVGHFSDPADFPGLAHFCEHMLFLGTEKYPDENSYSDYLEAHGGRTNAYTSTESTNYYFDVMHEHLEGALDRFAQFFIAPMFTESATDRERKAVDSENAKNLQSDGWRILQLTKSLAASEHPFHKFGTGNAETLKNLPGCDQSLRNALLQFHAQYYSASIMKLAVIGSQPIETLREWVVEKFSPIVNRYTEPPHETFIQSLGADAPPAFPPANLGKVVNIIPVKDLRELRLLFVVPPLRTLYKSQPERYLGHLLGHEGNGSVLSYLKQLDLASGLVAGLSHSSPDFSILMVGVDLSEEGLKRWKEVVEILFEYIAMMKASGPKQEIFEEIQLMGRTEFHFKDKSRAQDYVGFLATSMQRYAPEDVVSGAYLLEEYQPNVIQDFMNRMIPTNLLVLLVAKDFEEEQLQFEEEPWYKTQYAARPISKEEMKQWSTSSTRSELFTPAPNEYIPEKLDVKAPVEGVPTGDASRDVAPTLIKETPLMMVYHKHDSLFNLPKANIFLAFVTPKAYESPRAAVCTNLYVKMLEDHLMHKIYDAEVAGLQFRLRNSWNGVVIEVSGFDEKLRHLAMNIVGNMTSFRPDEGRFNVIRESTERSLRNFAMAQPYEVLGYKREELLTQTVWDYKLQINAVAELSYDDLFSFCNVLFEHVHIKIFAHGNLFKEEAEEFSEEVSLAFSGSKALPQSMIPERRVVKLPSQQSFVHRMETLNPANKNSGYLQFWQVGPETAPSNGLLDVSVQILREPAFDTLRTKQQLGYIVFTSALSSNGIQGLRLIIQSSVADGEYLEQRAVGFLEGFASTLNDMDDETFGKHISAVIAKLEQKDDKLSQESARHWSVIKANKDRFDMRKREVQFLRSLTKPTLIEFFRDHFTTNGTKLATLSLQLYGGECDITKPASLRPAEPSAEEVGATAIEVSKEAAVAVQLPPRVEIDDPVRFRRSHGLFPNYS